MALQTRALPSFIARLARASFILTLVALVVDLALLATQAYIYLLHKPPILVAGLLQTALTDTAYGGTALSVFSVLIGMILKRRNTAAAATTDRKERAANRLDFVAQDLQQAPQQIARLQSGQGCSLSLMVPVLGVSIAVLAVTLVAPISQRGYRVYTWGYGTTGGNSAAIKLPAKLTDVTAVATGFSFCVFLQGDGTVTAVGDPSILAVKVPTGLNDATAIAAAGQHALALRSNGTVVSWGDPRDPAVPVPAGLSHVVAIAAGPSDSYALLSDGTVRNWGSDFGSNTTAPAYVTDIASLGDGVALKHDGTLVAWGPFSQSSVASYANVAALAANGAVHVLLKRDGTVAGWGNDIFGADQPPANLNHITAVFAGNRDGIGLKSDGSMVIWGDNFWGQIQDAPHITGVVAASCGFDYCVALAIY